MPPRNTRSFDSYEHDRLRHRRFTSWLSQLRSEDRAFADASPLCRDDAGEWQAAVYLLTGTNEIWSTLERDIVGQISIAPVILEIEHPSRPWSSGEREVIRWATHFWDVGLRYPGYPYIFDSDRFQRWIAACHLYRRTPPLFTEARQ